MEKEHIFSLFKMKKEQHNRVKRPQQIKKHCSLLIPSSQKLLFAFAFQNFAATLTQETCFQKLCHPSSKYVVVNVPT